MAVQNVSTRQQEITAIWAQHMMTYRILSGFILVGIGVFLGMNAFHKDIGGYMTNLYTETMSIVVTVFILDLVNRRRDDERRTRELLDQLTRQLGSSVNVETKRATEELRHYGWLKDGTLKGVDLSRANLEKTDLIDADFTNTIFNGANLQGAQLHYAKLQGAQLRRANLSHAILFEADLQDATLMDANLEGATLPDANLTNAELGGANLSKAKLSNATMTRTKLANSKLTGATLNLSNMQEATLFGADLRGAFLNGTNLKGANLKFAKMQDAQLMHSRFGKVQLDETTILPDGTCYQPSIGLEQLERFTNQHHPDFWMLKW